ncbi:uncharacterized protein FIBRA_03634 [Fibroporia radiculosa]|uniref:Uncharacterized protein n=1 Tax=Fibroporia radiculosa TaxID=599839 RepID=J4H2I3_9APHY|nr:uncharacterized protein FIBRA_03634 [Fibroporia radiculosa]CCM01574.1 predicted protein [Fibroporia radiculosa]
MPPKRKASAMAEPATRSSKIVRNTQDLVATRRSTRKRVGTSLESGSESEQGADTQVAEAETHPRTRNTRVRHNAPETPRPGEPSTSRIQLPSPITTNRRGNRAHFDEPDELLLKPSKKRVAPPITPPRGTALRIATPRTFLQCVEIVTPSKGLLAGSPTPRPGRHRLGIHELLNTPIQPPSPSPIKRPVSPVKRRLAQTAPASPSPSKIPVSIPLPFISEPASPPVSPKKTARSATTPTHSPSKRRLAADSLVSPSRPIRELPPHLHPSLRAQQCAILRSLRDIPDIETPVTVDEDGPPTNNIALEQLSNLLNGTVVRGEGNSCLLIGPRGSGKSRLIEQAIISVPENPIVIRLSGHAQQNDRQAIREIARQLTQQTGSSFLPAEEEAEVHGAFTDPENPFLDSPDATANAIALPAPAHLLALISMVPTLPRATIVVIDAFDQFATHARQSLLYCLLDTAQSCRVGKGHKGLAVVGVTTRVDTINLLEKRVKSRFSGRMLRTACPARLSYWTELARAILTTPLDVDDDDEWGPLWVSAVDDFLRQNAVVEVLQETFALTRDVQTLRRILTPMVLELSPTSPFLSATKFAESVPTQRCPSRFPFLNSLSYPAICLLIAAMHAQRSGHDSFTFEMLHEAFRDQVRTSQSAPVQVEGGSIGMVRCSREVLFGAFDRLVAMRVLLTTVPPSNSIAKEFVMYRCAIDRADVKRAVEVMGQTSLKKWLKKMQ